MGEICRHFFKSTTPVRTENLNPDVMVMEAAQDRVRFNRSGPLNGARNRCIFVQRLGEV